VGLTQETRTVHDAALAGTVVFGSGEGAAALSMASRCFPAGGDEHPTQCHESTVDSHPHDDTV
jgi:hypothetical protein